MAADRRSVSRTWRGRSSSSRGGDSSSQFCCEDTLELIGDTAAHRGGTHSKLRVSQMTCQRHSRPLHSFFFLSISRFKIFSSFILSSYHSRFEGRDTCLWTQKPTAVTTFSMNGVDCWKHRLFSGLRTTVAICLYPMTRCCHTRFFQVLENYTAAESERARPVRWSAQVQLTASERANSGSAAAALNWQSCVEEQQ